MIEALTRHESPVRLSIPMHSTLGGLDEGLGGKTLPSWGKETLGIDILNQLSGTTHFQAQRLTFKQYEAQLLLFLKRSLGSVMLCSLVWKQRSCFIGNFLVYLQLVICHDLSISGEVNCFQGPETLVSLGT